MLYIEKGRASLLKEWENLSVRYHQITGIHLLKEEVDYALETLCDEDRKCSLQAILAFQLRYGLEDGKPLFYDEIADALNISRHWAQVHVKRVSFRLHWRRARETVQVEQQIRRIRYDRRNKQAAENRQRAMASRYG